MSDSDEGAFASADEGDSPKVNEGNKKTKEVNRGNSQKGNESVNKPKSDPSPKGADGNSRSKGKQQQKQPAQSTKKKERGRGSGQQKVKGETGPASPSTDALPANSPRDSKETSSTESESLSSLSKSSTEAGSSDTGKPSAVPEEANAEEKSTEARKAEEAKTKQAGDIRQGITGGIDAEGKDKCIPETKNIGEAAGDKVDQQQAEALEKGNGGGWGWSSWGTSIISAASNSVQTFTDQVGDGISTIIDTVESSLGVPDPEELARANKSSEGKEAKESSTTEAEPKDQGGITAQPEARPIKADEEKKEVKEESTQPKEGGGGGWFSSWGVANIAKKVSDTGKSIASKGQTLMTEGFDAVENLASGGIDVLESIGKKTYNTLSEHDPAFKKTRDYLKARQAKPNLSSLLREAKEQAEVDVAQQQEKDEARKAHFETLFDEYQGIAHLEALEMLSNQSEKKVHSLLNSLSTEDLRTIKPLLIAIKEVFEVDDTKEQEADGSSGGAEQDFSSLVSQHLAELELGTAPDKLHKVHAMVRQWMLDFDTQDSGGDKQTPKIIHQQAIQSLAELTSKGVEQFHKAGELVLMQRESDKDCTERAHSFARLTGVLCHEIGNLATKFSDCLNKTAGAEEEKTDITSLVTNVYLEASNSSTYVQDAFQLLLPVLQQAAIEHAILSRPT